MLYKVLRAAFRFLLRPRIRFEGCENIPADGAVVLIINHCHAFDPVVVALAAQRPVHFLAKKELFASSAVSRFFKKLHCIPIDRDNMDRAALREAVDVLKNQGVLGVFPEGTRSKTGELLPFKSGACYVASQAPCRIVPVAVEGAGRLLRIFSAPAKVRFGTPFAYEALEGEKRRETLERMTRKQEDAVRALLKMP